MGRGNDDDDNAQKLQSEEPLRSPTLEFIESFPLSAFSIADLTNRGFGSENIAEVKVKDIGQLSRRNVCEWVYENRKKFVQEMIPDDHPRFFNTAMSNITVRRVGLGLFILMFMLLAITMVLTLKLEIKETVHIFGVGCWVWMLLGEQLELMHSTFSLQFSSLTSSICYVLLSSKQFNLIAVRAYP